MRISKIEEEITGSLLIGIYKVTFTPYWLGRLFGRKEKTRRYKDDGTTFVFGGGTVYIREDGSKTTNSNRVGIAIDKWRRKF